MVRVDCFSAPPRGSTPAGCSQHGARWGTWQDGADTQQPASQRARQKLWTRRGAQGQWHFEHRRCCPFAFAAAPGRPERPHRNLAQNCTTQAATPWPHDAAGRAPAWAAAGPPAAQRRGLLARHPPYIDAEQHPRAHWFAWAQPSPPDCRPLPLQPYVTPHALVLMLARPSCARNACCRLSIPFDAGPVARDK